MIHYITTQGIGQPWVANELHQIDKVGVPFCLHAMRAPEHEHFKSLWAERMNQETRLLYPLPVVGFFVSIIAAPLRFRGRLFSALCNALFGRRESLRGRIAMLAHLVVACHWARHIGEGSVTHIHAQWAHSSASIGMYGAWLLGVPFSFTGHAVDLFRDRVALSDKIRRAEFIVCISTFHRDFFLKEGARPEQLIIVYCGIDTSVFHASLRDRARGERFRILSAGRLVDKKGFEYLIDACKILAQKGREFECFIEGSGPSEGVLRRQIQEQGLVDRITLTGKPITQEDIPGFMHSGDVFVLACIWAKDNDVDGLPQLTMEAMACGLPAISTRLVGNTDLIVNDESGLLVAPECSAELADAILRIMDDFELAVRLAKGGRKRVCEQFDIKQSLLPLINRYRAKVGLPIANESETNSIDAKNEPMMAADP